MYRVFDFDTYGIIYFKTKEEARQELKLLRSLGHTVIMDKTDDRS